MPRPVLPAALCALLSAAASAPSQKVKWRHDYAAAVKEAADTGRPLLIDVGAAACAWCRKLDATTFRDPVVARELNGRFVPVKIDGHSDPRLTAGLKVDAFPALIVATPDGWVVGRHAGYADAGQLAALLAKAPPTATPGSDRMIGGEQRRAKAAIDAELDALYPAILAGLDRKPGR